MCDEYMKSIDSGVCHRPWSILLWIVQVCSRTIKYQVHQHGPNTGISEHSVSKLWTILQQIPFLLPLNWWWSMHGVARLTNKHSQFGTFSQPCSNRTFSNCLSHNSPAGRWPYKFRSRGTTGSSILDHDLGHLCRGRRIQMSGHSDMGIFNNFGASSIFTWV